MISSWLQTSLAVYLLLNKLYLVSENHLALHHLISPGGRICQMESLSQATLICLIFKQQWTLHEAKIAVSSQVWTHWIEGWSGVCGQAHLGRLFQMGYQWGNDIHRQPAASCWSRLGVTLCWGMLFLLEHAALDHSSLSRAGCSQAVSPWLLYKHCPHTWEDTVGPRE